jgi:hypothetical protein
MQPESNLEDLLLQIKTHFYQNHACPVFYRDRRMLLYALTWPATWLDQKGLNPTKEQYNHLISHKLEDIKKYGDPQKYNLYFPRYLLSSLQDHLTRNGETLYEEWKHIRNQMCKIESIVKKLHINENKPSFVSILNEANKIVKPKKRTQKDNPKQMTFF